MKTFRRLMLILLVVLSISALFVIPAFAYTWTDRAIGQAQYSKFQNGSSAFTIEDNVRVSTSITFNRNVSTTVRTGYFKPLTFPSNYTTVFRGYNSTTINGSYTIEEAGQYKFFIYNGSSDAVMVSIMTVTF